MTAVDPRFDRSVRRWLWAYPRRWRWARADEVIGTLADLAPATATRLDVRSGFGLVVHGLATRRRMRPPLRVRLRYRWVSGVVPPEHRGWVADDIAGPLFLRGPALGSATSFLVLTLLNVHDGRAGVGNLAPWAVYVAGVYALPSVRARRAAAARHLVVRPGDPPTAWDLLPGWVYRDRLAARPYLSLAAAAVAAVTVLPAVLTVQPWTRGGPAWIVCLVIGALVAARLAARWRRRLPGRPAQPARHMVVADSRWKASLWCWAVFLGLIAVPGTALLSRDRVVLAPVVLGGALAVLPVLPVLGCAALLTRNAPDDIAVVDVWRLLVGRGPLPVDTLERGVVPASFALQAPDGFGYAPPPPPTPATA